MRTYSIYTFTYNRDSSHRDAKLFRKGDVSKYLITDRTDEEMDSLSKNDIHESVWAAMVLYVNGKEDSEVQLSRAKVIQNYLNKVVESQARAAQGIEMGFLK